MDLAHKKARNLTKNQTNFVAVVQIAVNEALSAE